MVGGRVFLFSSSGSDFLNDLTWGAYCRAVRATALKLLQTALKVNFR